MKRSIKGKAYTISIDSREKSILCAKEAIAKKAMNTVILDVRKIASFAEYFVICSGKSDRQVRAIANHIEITMREMQVDPNHIEGLEAGQWVLMDYDDVIVHIFLDPIRQFYDLEGLWSDAKRIVLKEAERGKVRGKGVEKTSP
jgi:ribosome-associated protein